MYSVTQNKPPIPSNMPFKIAIYEIPGKVGNGVFIVQTHQHVKNEINSRKYDK